MTIRLFGFAIPDSSGWTIGGGFLYWSANLEARIWKDDREDQGL